MKKLLFGIVFLCSGALHAQDAEVPTVPIKAAVSVAGCWSCGQAASCCFVSTACKCCAVATAVGCVLRYTESCRPYCECFDFCCATAASCCCPQSVKVCHHLSESVWHHAGARMCQACARSCQRLQSDDSINKCCVWLCEMCAEDCQRKAHEHQQQALSPRALNGQAPKQKKME